MNEVTVIRPPDAFGPSDHATLAKVAQAAGSKIVDCTRLATVPLNIAAVATANWSAPRGSVPRLAIVLELDVWAVARISSAAPISTLREHGTDLRLLYRTQLESGLVHRWITDGIEPHAELTQTLEQLDTVWSGSPLAANVIDAFAELTAKDESLSKPLYLARLASISAKCGEQTRALDFARTALRSAVGKTDDAATQAQTLAMSVTRTLLGEA